MALIGKLAARVLSVLLTLERFLSTYSAIFSVVQVAGMAVAVHSAALTWSILCK